MLKVIRCWIFFIKNDLLRGGHAAELVKLSNFDNFGSWRTQAKVARPLRSRLDIFTTNGLLNERHARELVNLLPGSIFGSWRTQEALDPWDPAKIFCRKRFTERGARQGISQIVEFRHFRIVA
ncbi:MAG: hypothetical protein R2867_05325 [Caldilineaceae bacterium]